MERITESRNFQVQFSEWQSLQVFTKYFIEKIDFKRNAPGGEQTSVLRSPGEKMKRLLSPLGTFKTRKCFSRTDMTQDSFPILPT